MQKTIDLNCDMGESFGHWTIGEASDEDLMAFISSANVAAGFHAGDPNTINRTVKLVRDYGVGLGAHPGYNDLQGFGRRFISASNEELVNDILYQVGAVREFGRYHGVRLQHVKPHGALYMEAARNEDLSLHLIESLRAGGGEVPVMCMGGSATYEVGQRLGHPMVREFYADRDYGDDGAIIFTRRVGRPDPQAIADKCLRACVEGKVKTVTGGEVDVAFESICFHSDTPGALEMAKAIRETLSAGGVKIAPVSTVLGLG